MDPETPSPLFQSRARKREIEDRSERKMPLHMKLLEGFFFFVSFFSFFFSLRKKEKEKVVRESEIVDTDHGVYEDPVFPRLLWFFFLVRERLGSEKAKPLPSHRLWYFIIYSFECKSMFCVRKMCVFWVGIWVSFFLFVWRLESEFLSSPFSGGIKRVFNVGISVYAYKYPCAMQASMQLLLVYAITLESKCP